MMIRGISASISMILLSLQTIEIKNTDLVSGALKINNFLSPYHESTKIFTESQVWQFQICSEWYSISS